MEKWNEMMKEILRCPNCYEFPMTRPVFMCRLGHHICGSCYGGKCKSASGDNEIRLVNNSVSSCTACGSEYTDTRNILAEQLMDKVSEFKDTFHEAQSEPSPPSECYSQDELCLEYEEGDNHPHLFSNRSQIAEDDVKSLNNFIQRFHRYPQMEQNHTSYRPVRCPVPYCRRMVAVTAITPHFSYDHSEVPMLSVDPGQSSHLHVSPDAIPFDKGRCICLLLLSGKSRIERSRNTTPSTATKLKTYLPLPILAARIRTNDELSVGEHGYILIVWVAHAVDDQMHCTIEATNFVMDTRTLKYSGPISSMRYSQAPLDVYARGDCLVINPGHLLQLMPDAKGYDLNITIH